MKQDEIFANAEDVLVDNAKKNISIVCEKIDNAEEKTSVYCLENNLNEKSIRKHISTIKNLKNRYDIKRFYTTTNLITYSDESISAYELIKYFEGLLNAGRKSSVK